MSAQVATVTGYVHDSTAAAIVGAKVNIVQAETGERRETARNERGEFNAQYPRRGLYNLMVTASGFKTQSSSGMTPGGGPDGAAAHHAAARCRGAIRGHYGGCAAAR